MRKIQLLASFFVIALLIISCKKQSVTDQVVTENDTLTVAQKDSIALVKEARQKERDALAKPYDDQEDAQSKINELLVQAKAEGKNVFVQAGGNWCIWCLRFNDYLQKTPELKQIVDDNFIYYHLNYSKENKNEAIFEKYAPEGKKMGYPFFFVLDSNDQVLNVISSVELENTTDKSSHYDLEKTKQMFLSNVAK
ncbi:thioredoxin family protein [Flavobacterium agricola]|uniref:Thioredoxin family protein n=1 Tax=Flavobacterium agricola TaxID=2870839 RepID=A0ABY6M4G9_9FLAO|nr:thioredoxin family protein [Flavobacterium agricola]UYW02533.1 thioredoxin family protein [Flavobacterium agricola]